jgi:ADP-ribose pyrophosphatase YjhB (NUDIX family)
LPWPTPPPAGRAGCGRTIYRNPLPVAVVPVPVVDRKRLLAIRRAIEPGKGRPALPGGYIDWNDRSWQEAAAREVREETGLCLRAAGLREFRVISSTERKILIVFAIAEGVRSRDLPAFTAGEEVGGLMVIDGPARPAFPSHTQAVREYFAGQGRKSRRAATRRRPVR